MINPYASFDCLSVGHQLQKWLGDVAITEFQLFTYLACLLSLYQKHPVSDWGYEYVGTKLGAPFSSEIAEAVSELQRADLIMEKGACFLITGEGENEYKFLRSLSQNAEREIFLEGACSSILALPIGIIREALAQEPELHHSLKVPMTRRLLEEGPGLAALYEHFSVLSEAIGLDIQDLMVPAVIWLTYLSQASQHKEIIGE